MDDEGGVVNHRPTKSKPAAKPKAKPKPKPRKTSAKRGKSAKTATAGQPKSLFEELTHLTDSLESRVAPESMTDEQRKAHAAREAERQWMQQTFDLGTTRGKKLAVLYLWQRNLGTVALLCRKVGISRETFYNWIGEDAEFAKLVDEQQANLIDLSENVVYEDGIKNREVSTAQWILERARKSAYSLRHEITGADGAPIAQTMSPNEQMAAFKESIKALGLTEDDTLGEFIKRVEGK